VTSQQVEFTIVPEGPFSLRESAVFGFGQRSGSWDGLMRMAFCLDGYRGQVGVVVRQDDAGVHVEGWGSDDADAIRSQVARVLSLDHDGRIFTAIGDADPVVRRLQEAAPGLRPPLFYSPYEAAVWAVLSARRPQRQMAEVRRKLSEAHGRTFELAGAKLAALPTPAQLLAVDSIPGVPAEKLDRMHGIARAALDGILDARRLLAMGPDAALADMQKLRGIGPFYSSLIVVRATGFADVLPDEPIMRGLVARLYGLPAEPTTTELTELAEAWRPMRTWVTVLVRVAGPRILGASGPSMEAEA
jgi:DNA-3-methyladenine glycosylase II